jgi:hypothetical protein
MTITNTWAVIQMDAYPEYEGEPDVVFTVHWTLSGTDGTYVGYHSYGSVGITLTEGSTFTPYADLTLDQVLGWVWTNGVDKDAQEAAVAAQIENQINPTVVTPPLPWSA